ncbi:MAG TPA: ATP-binding protein [Polyangiales bacterium]|nr:ATP-binding protein [Polyangiales bacterium]
MGIRGKLFAASLALIALVGLAGALYLERELTRLQEEEFERSLIGRARTAREAAYGLTNPNPAIIDPLADRLGQATDSRITFFDQAGNVVGDSALSLGEIAREENQLDMPEVRAAANGEPLVVRRYSPQLGKDLLYATVPWYEVHGVVRLSTPLDAFEDLLSRQRVLVGLASGLGLFLAVLVSALAAHVAGRVVSSLAADARAVATGGSTRLPVLSEDELGQLARSLNRLADERSETIDALVQERDRLNTILHGVSEGLLAIDSENRVDLANDAAKNLLGLRVDPVGRKLVETIRIPALVNLTEQSGTDQRTAEFAVEDPARYLLATTTPLRATGGVVIVLHDMTGIRNMENIRRDLVANVSHELRTPVSIIRANAETLLDGALQDPEQARTFVQAILRHSERLSSLLSDLLDLAKIEGGAYPLCLENLNVCGAVQRAVDTLSRSAKNKGVSIRVSVPSDMFALADIQALDQVLVNLLDNAIKYSFEAGVIEIKASATHEEVRIIVSDDGPGIAERHRSRIFERFYRIDSGRSRALGGTGLGLSIVKHLAMLMHGTVGVEPVVPRGSAFWITLPQGVVSTEVVSHLSH